MYRVIISNEVFIKNKPCRGPGPLLRTVDFPVDEVLQSSTSLTTVQKLLDGESFPAVNDSGSRRGGRGLGTGYEFLQD